MSNKAPYSKTGLLILIVGLAAFATMGIFYVSMQDRLDGASDQMIIAATVKPQAGNAIAAEAAPEEPAPVEEVVAEEPVAPEEPPAVPANIDIEAAKGVRGIGDTNAPVKMTEFSSLTCPHCAHFHKEVLGALKEKYVDSGKLYIEFVDFPLNAPALQASQIARCLPAERYFPFVQLLFETQEKWAFEKDYMQYLKQNAQLAGLATDQADACVANEDLQKFITGKIEEAQAAHDVKSTPTFIINGEKVSGSQPLKEFEKIIDAALTKQGKE